MRRCWRLLKLGFGGGCCGAAGRIWLLVLGNAIAAGLQTLWVNPMLVCMSPLPLLSAACYDLHLLTAKTCTIWLDSFIVFDTFSLDDGN
jgi:hypothetical protein